MGGGKIDLTRVVHRSYKVQKVETKEDLSAIRNKYNNWVNKHLGFKS